MNKRIYPKLHADFGENGKAGFVNAEGDFVISPIWEYAYDFHNGLGEVIDHRKNCRFVDIEGKLYDSHHLSRKELVKIRNGNGKVREYEKNNEVNFNFVFYHFIVCCDFCAFIDHFHKILRSFNNFILSYFIKLCNK